MQALREIGHHLSVLRLVPHAPPIGQRWSAFRAVPSTYDCEGFEVQTKRIFRPPRMFGYEYLAPLLAPGLRREIIRTKADLIHAHYLIPSGYLAVQQRLVPSVVTAHGGDAYRAVWKRPGLKYAGQRTVLLARRVTAVSDYIRKSVQRLSPARVDVIFNGADEDVFYPRERRMARDRLSINPDRFVVAFAGALVRSKGVFDLVEAAERISANRPLLLFAGSGGTELRAHATAAGVDARILGVLPQSEIATIFSSADVVALPSYSEGLPAVLCEALLSGRSVVATAVGGIPEIVINEWNGLLTDTGDIDGLAAALRRIASNATLRRRFEKNAAVFAKEHLTWRLNAKAYDTLYRDVLEGDHHPER